MKVRKHGDKLVITFPISVIDSFQLKEGDDLVFVIRDDIDEMVLMRKV